MKKIFFGFVVSLSLALPLVAMDFPRDMHWEDTLNKWIDKLGVENPNFSSEDIRNHISEGTPELMELVEQITPILNEELNAAAIAGESDIPTAAELDAQVDVTFEEDGDLLNNPQSQYLCLFLKCLFKQDQIDKLDA